MPDDIKKAINNKNLTDDIKQQYVRILTGEKKDIAQELITTQIDNFDPLVDVQKFENVVNALDSIDDVARMQRVFDQSYLNTLGDYMMDRYERLFQQIQDGNVPKPPDYVGTLTVSDRLTVLDNVRSLKTKFVNAIQDAVQNNRLSQAAADILKISERNISYARYEITYPGGKTIGGEIVAVSGKTSQTLINSVGSIIDGKTIVTPIPRKKESKFFKATREGGANDSERKSFEYILREIKQNNKPRETGVNFQPNGGYKGKGFKGEITIYSEMKPCDSCEKVMIKQFQDYFGTDIKVNIKYGVEYKNLSHY